MERDSLQAHLDNRFDRLEQKLDNHLDRISKSEAEIHWIKGVAKFSITLLISLAGFLARIFWSHKW